MGRGRDRCGDPWKDQGVVFVFYLYHTPVVTVSLGLVIVVREQERGGCKR